MEFISEHGRKMKQGILYLRGAYHMEYGRVDEAARLFRDMVENDATDYNPHHELAILHTKKKEYALAEVEYRRAVELVPKGREQALYYQFGQVLFHNLASKGEFEEAVLTGQYSLSTPVIAELIAVLDKSIELNPENCRRASHQRAFVYFIARDYPMATVSARKYISAFGAENADETQKARIMIEDCMRLMCAP